MFEKASWIRANTAEGGACPVFARKFSCERKIGQAKLFITALGVYEARLNGERVGDFILAPGWTSYRKRLQYQEYDVTELLSAENQVEVTVGNGWCVGSLTWYNYHNNWNAYKAILAELHIEYEDGTREIVATDKEWRVASGSVLYAELYHGETCDARVKPSECAPVECFYGNKENLIPQEGERVIEHERIAPVRVIYTPRGEKVLDFGQNLVGYVEFSVTAKAGEAVALSHAEVLDKEGNFYTENLRCAEQKLRYICREGVQTYKPHFTFMGFRYVRIDEAPDGLCAQDVRAVVVHSDMRRTGRLDSANPLLNQLFSNITWGQRGNFLDVPTDCPQRDERLGWTGDAQVFVKTASYQYDVRKFFRKWLRDLSADQFQDGNIPNVVPDMLGIGGSAGWGDAAVICPWQLYLTYGDKRILEEQIDSMKRWIEYIRAQGTSEYLWDTGKHFGDWLEPGQKPGHCEGTTDHGLIATAFYAYSVSLVVKSLRALGHDTREYEHLHANIVQAFQRTYPVYDTQTAHVLALHFRIAKNPEQTAASLVDLIHANGDKLTTGFLGTPYLLYALSDNGYADVAYSLLLQESYPSWLFPVKMGATTIWEQWYGRREDGELWRADMNSFNHYAYGSVGAWVYEVAAGLCPDEEEPGFAHVLLQPHVDFRLPYLSASIDTVSGRVNSEWRVEGDTVCYEFEVPNRATLMLAGEVFKLERGHHVFRQTKTGAEPRDKTLISLR